MNRIASLYAIPLLLAGSIAMAADDRSTDLRYCLDLPTDLEIAKCAGEISADKKGKPFSKAEVEKMLSREKANTPAGADMGSDIQLPAADSAPSSVAVPDPAPTPISAPAGDQPAKDIKFPQFSM